MTARQCAWCLSFGREATLQQCTGCSKTYYCNRACQKAHWILHKTRCTARKPGDDNCTTLADVNEVLAGLTDKHDRRKRESVTKVLGCLQPLPLFWSQFLAVRRSEVHGLGVFATRSLPPGAVLTGYPCHLMAVGRAVQQVCDGEVDATPENLQHLADVYSYRLGGTLLTGLPERYAEQRLLGHMLNDGCLVDVFHGTPLDALRDLATHARLLKQYYTNVLRHCNCKFQQDALGLAVYVISTRVIAPDEELLLSYGLPYWLDHNYGAHVDEMNPFLIQNLLTLRETDAEFRAISDASLRQDYDTLMGQ